MKKRDKRQQNKIQKITRERAQYEKARRRKFMAAKSKAIANKTAVRQ